MLLSQTKYQRSALIQTGYDNVVTGDRSDVGFLDNFLWSNDFLMLLFWIYLSISCQTIERCIGTCHNLGSIFGAIIQISGSISVRQVKKCEFIVLACIRFPIKQASVPLIVIHTASYTSSGFWRMMAIISVIELINVYEKKNKESSAHIKFRK